MNSEIPDAWFLKACCNSYDETLYNEYFSKAKELIDKSLGIVEEKDCEKYVVYTITITITPSTNYNLSKASIVLDNNETKEVIPGTSVTFKALKGSHEITGIIECKAVKTFSSSFSKSIMLQSNESYYTKYKGGYKHWKQIKKKEF